MNNLKRIGKNSLLIGAIVTITFTILRILANEGAQSWYKDLFGIDDSIWKKILKITDVPLLIGIVLLVIGFILVISVKNDSK